MDSEDLEKSILTSSNINSIGTSKMKTVTAFDNIFVLPSTVPLTTLRDIGCGSMNQLISTNPITATQLQKILQEAFRHG